MKENNINTENLLLINKTDTVESNNNQTTKQNFLDSPKKDELLKYVKEFIIKEIDIQNLIENLNNLKCCLNQFLDSIIEDPSRISQLLEIRRKNIKIKMYKIFNTYSVCKWCGDNCLKNTSPKEIDINFSKISNKYCNCANENHALIYTERLSLNPEDKKAIDEIGEIHYKNNIDVDLKKKVIKENIINFLKGKEKKRFLLIISYIINLDFLNIYFSNDDEIYKNILSCLKENKDYSQFNKVMYFYFQHFMDNIKKDEAPIFIFNETDNKISIPALCYYEPDAFSYSFFFQVYRKIIVSKSFENKNIFLFLRQNGISNDILCSYLINCCFKPIEMYSFGFFSFDSILNNTNIELSEFKQNIDNNIIYILINQFCDIFSDFMNYGETKRNSLVDNSIFSKLFYEKIIQFVSKFFGNFVSFKITKKILIQFPLFKLSFNDENKERILIVLSNYSFSLAEKKNIFNEDSDSKIFNLIEEEIKNIVNKKKCKKYNSEQNLIIVKKLFDLYNLNYNNYTIEELNSFDFNSLIQNLIEKDYPIKLLEKVLEKINNLNEKNKKNLNIYFEYILKILLLFCTNIFGSSYIYNSNFISKILIIIKKIDFNEFTDFFLEIIFILKVCFNRKIIDLSFLTMENDEKLMTLKEYLFYILFRNEPIMRKDSFYFFINFDKLLKRIKTNYKFIFEKSKNIFINSFKNINIDESYLNIIKFIVLKMKEEFSKNKWEIDIKDIFKNYNLEEDQKLNEYLKENEEIIEKKINEETNEETKNIKEKIPDFILIDILRCLENLNQTNFYLNFEEDSFFINEKYDISSIIINENLPFAIKSLILNFLVKLVLIQKIDSENNKIFGPLLYTTEFENNVEHSMREKNIITIESKESEKHLNETIKLMKIFVICIEFLKKKRESLDFKKAFIEKNGLYDFGVSIINAINCFCNLIINTNKIHELYLINFRRLILKFFEVENFFIKIINIKINYSIIMTKLKEKFNYKEQMENIIEVYKIIQNYIEKITSDSINFSERKNKNIFQNFIDYNNFLTTDSNNHYSFIFGSKNEENISLEELNNFNNLDSSINLKILNNFNKWKEYINKTSKNIKSLIDNVLDSKNQTLNQREIFYYKILIHISNYESKGEFILNDCLFLKYLIKQIRNDEKFFEICNNEKMKLIIEDFFILKIDNIDDFKAKIIGNIIKKIYFLTNYEILISNSFSNSKHENYLSELLNCLILFLEVLGENFNQFFHEAIFKYKFDFSLEKNHFPVAKKDEESKTIKKLNEEKENYNIFSPYEILLKLHEKIFNFINITNDEKYRETQQNNLLIIFNSLTHCIIEYSNVEHPFYKDIILNLYKKYFFWKREDKSYNPIFYLFILKLIMIF